MTQAEALRLVAMLASEFRTEVSDETGILWARQLMPYDLEDGLEAVDILAKGTAFMPQGPKPLLDLMKDIRLQRLGRKALPSMTHGVPFSEWLAQQDEETIRKCRAFFPRLMKTIDVNMERL
jgi:hypothetical protein